MKSATTTEITRHMITAMTMPTYRATSSVLGATGGGRGERGRFGEQKQKKEPGMRLRKDDQTCVLTTTFWKVRRQ